MLDGGSNSEKAPGPLVDWSRPLPAGNRPERSCLVVDAGCIGYDLGLNLQVKARSLVEAGAWDGILLLLEHHPVITVGRKGGEENLLLEEHQLFSKGVPLVRTNRGGNITGHNPGQLVGYPILNLRKWQQDVHWYIRSLEAVLVETLACFALPAGRKPPLTGVWIDDEKIAAIGILISRWVTSHGFALNVNNDLELFRFMVPCGISEYGVTSLARSGIEVGMDQVKTAFISQFQKIFGCIFSEIMKSGQGKAPG
jgi:lipoyl(octanoyl) transferase